MNFVSDLIEAHVFRQMGEKIEFLLLKRAESDIYPGIWQMVSGKIIKGEKAFETVLREIKEETGMKPLKLWVAPNVNSFYDHTNDSISFLPVFAALVKESNEVFISEEHSEFKWAEPEEAKKLLVWPGQRYSVDVIYRYFKEEIESLNMVAIDI